MENAASEPQEQPSEPAVVPVQAVAPVDSADAESNSAESPSAETAPGEGGETGAVAGLDIGSQSEPAVLEVRLPNVIRGKIESDGTAVSTGRRKTAVARVRVRKGTGKIMINGRDFESYFPVERHRLLIEAPLRATGVFGQYDVWVRATGGGVNGQAGAVILGVARAIQALHPEQHGALSDGGFLTRDDRMVERKKYGHRKARRSFQFSKR
jgi:small subunit ribosomal protein S9